MLKITFLLIRVQQNSLTFTVLLVTENKTIKYMVSEMNFSFFSIQYSRNGTIFSVNTVKFTSTTVLVAKTKNPTTFTF